MELLLDHATLTASRFNIARLRHRVRYFTAEAEVQRIGVQASSSLFELGQDIRVASEPLQVTGPTCARSEGISTWRN
ncbi:hypothetical protein CU103_19020 [Phyllobacterium sophorae]|uniref:Uncharacterized protein n=1 Tax=Phyllobacterium sophorae TaxID=1520277 RepID=A0A2P7B7L3_9HYPH|nr:hypothetical protein CU103_19020 [Phyllobacterium sophorae]